MNLAHGYIRVSADERAKSRLGLEVQKNAIELYYKTVLEPQGIGWAGIFEEGKVLPDGTVDPEGVSASNIKFFDRPVGNILWHRLREGDWVICYKLDRIIRMNLDFHSLVPEIRKRKIHFQMLDIGVDLLEDTSNVNLYSSIMAAFASAEAQRIGERTREAKAVKKRQGYCITNGAPLGHKLRRNPKGDLVIEHCDETRKIMKFIYHLHKQGMSRHKIVFYLIKHRIMRPIQKIHGKKGRIERKYTEWKEWSVQEAIKLEREREKAPAQA